MRVAEKVLEHSIRENLGTEATVEFHPQEGESLQEVEGWRPYTGFSLLRWRIPETFEFRGKAIYLDADQLCLGDVGELWSALDEASNEDCVACTYYEHRNRFLGFPWFGTRTLAESSVMVIDCERARNRLWTMERIRQELGSSPTEARNDDIMHLRYLTPAPVALDSWWNVMDGRGGQADRFHDPRAKLLHFTRVSTQPWFYPEHPARDRWESALRGALDAGHVQGSWIREACDKFDPRMPRPQGMHPYWNKYASRESG